MVRSLVSWLQTVGSQSWQVLGFSLQSWEVVGFTLLAAHLVLIFLFTCSRGTASAFLQ